MIVAFLFLGLSLILLSLGLLVLLNLDTNKKDTELSLQIARLSKEMKALEAAMADAMIPAMRQATEAMKNMQRAFAGLKGKDT